MPCSFVASPSEGFGGGGAASEGLDSSPGTSASGAILTFFLSLLATGTGAGGAAGSSASGASSPGSSSSAA